jgi:hypothetical protein
VVVARLPAGVVPGDLRAVFALPWGPAAPCRALTAVRSVSAAAASLTLVTPPVDLAGAPSAVANVTISTASGAATALFEYSYMAVLPTVSAFAPAVASDTGGELVSVRLAAFPYPVAAVVVQYGDGGAFYSATIDPATSGPAATLASFIAPSAPTGATAVTVRLLPAGCAPPCASAASFVLPISASAAPAVTDSGPAAAPWQRLMALSTFPEIRLRGVPLSASIAAVSADVDVARAAQDGGEAAPAMVVRVGCARLVSRGNGTASVWLEFPASLAASASLRVTVAVAVMGDGGSGARRPCPAYALQLYDGALPRIAALAPTIAVAAAYVAGRRLDLRTRVRALLPYQHAHFLHP